MGDSEFNNVGESGSTLTNGEVTNNRNYLVANEIVLRMFGWVKDNGTSNRDIDFNETLVRWGIEVNSDNYVNHLSDGFNQAYEGCDVNVVTDLIKNRLSSFGDIGEEQSRLWLKETFLRGGKSQIGISSETTKKINEIAFARSHVDEFIMQALKDDKKFFETCKSRVKSLETESYGEEIIADFIKQYAHDSRYDDIKWNIVRKQIIEGINEFLSLDHMSSVKYVSGLQSRMKKRELDLTR